MKTLKLEDLVAATYTPLDHNDDLNLAAIEPIVADLIQPGIAELYVCGSTGEGMSLSSDDRIASLVGFKYTDTKLFEFQECLELEAGCFDVVWADDERLLGALGCNSDADSGALQTQLAAIGIHEWSQLPTIASDS